MFKTAGGYTGEVEVRENSSRSDEAQNEDNCRGKEEVKIQLFEAKRM